MTPMRLPCGRPCSGGLLSRGAGEAFAEIGAQLLAAEAFAEAAAAHRAAGRSGPASASSTRSRLFADACEGARTPALLEAPAAAELTAREREVAMMAASGLSSREIASRLFLSTRTVESHLQHVYGKLGVSDRSRIGPLLGLPAQDQ